MGRRNKRGGNRAIVPYDFVASFSAIGKSVTVSDLGITRNRSMRASRVSLSVAIVGSTQLPAAYISLYDTKEDIVNTSRSIVVGATAKNISVRAPRGTDFGDWATDNSPVFVITASNYYNGVITASGTVWIEYAPHKVTSKVALLGPFHFPPTEDVPSSTDDPWENLA